MVCLKRLDGPEGEHLRNTNSAQKKCLEGFYDGSRRRRRGACTAWTTCLADGDRINPTVLLSLLDAAEGDESLPSRRRKQVSKKTDTCLNPATEDPQSWACGCWNLMIKRCEQLKERMDDAGTGDDYSERKCLRAQYCTHKRVCPGWKAANCKGAQEAINKFLKKLNLNQGNRAHEVESQSRQPHLNQGDPDNPDQGDALLARSDGSVQQSSALNATLDDTTGHKACA
eukprot:gnl/TRDRNA2_/TRDRNA2_175607_c3_seq6.p1 gnl/TRDRNA2_/TRDRNA2_175607_c3~~gnl/TRDRNA2_/TRDRNA2_175607_c3_seq6.p1  ORF type:complete len:228 (-),score=29.83 gnl/TRDRNA2_/TRDRNA2_175607_c3_seq6:48-731(-)